MSMGVAWLVIITAEMPIDGRGIGYFIWKQWNNLDIANIIVAILLDRAFALLERRSAMTGRTTEGRLEFVGVEKAYPTKDGEYRTLAPISPADIEERQFVALIGPSGSGKSTVLRIVAGLEERTAGEIFMDGDAIYGPVPDRGMVFQDHVLFALDCKPGGRDAAARKKTADKHLAMVHLSRFAEKRPSQLSGGMKQRVGLARAFALDPRVLLMDEPLGEIDALTRGTMQAELLSIWELSAKTVLPVTHAADEAMLLADRIIVLSQGPQARIKADIPVPFERPRDQDEFLSSKEYPELHRELLGLLREEIAA